MEGDEQESDWYVVLAARDGAECFYCLRALTRKQSTRDHVIPRCKGGNSEDSNLVLACKSCNGAKGDKDPSGWPRGCRVDAYGDLPAPLVTPWETKCRQLSPFCRCARCNPALHTVDIEVRELLGTL